MDFTQEEKERITQLYGTDFQDVTPEDAQLIARWENWKAGESAETQAKCEAAQAVANAKMEQSAELARQAMSDLEELKNYALARLERLG